MGLKQYWKKRDFSKTAEPEGCERRKRARALRFCIQKHAREEGGRENWLLLKHDDRAARRGVRRDITESRPESVKTGRGLDEIAGGKSAVWQSNRRSDETPFEKRIAAAVAARKKKSVGKKAATKKPARRTAKKTAAKAHKAPARTLRKAA